MRRVDIESLQLDWKLLDRVLSEGAPPPEPLEGTRAPEGGPPCGAPQEAPEASASSDKQGEDPTSPPAAADKDSLLQISRDNGSKGGPPRGPAEGPPRGSPLGGAPLKNQNGRKKSRAPTEGAVAGRRHVCAGCGRQRSFYCSSCCCLVGLAAAATAATAASAEATTAAPASPAGATPASPAGAAPGAAAAPTTAAATAAAAAEAAAREKGLTIPEVRLPFKVHVLRHPKEKASKSSAIPLRLLAQQDLRLYEAQEDGTIQEVVPFNINQQLQQQLQQQQQQQQQQDGSESAAAATAGAAAATAGDSLAVKRHKGLNDSPSPTATTAAAAAGPAAAAAGRAAAASGVWGVGGAPGVPWGPQGVCLLFPGPSSVAADLVDMRLVKEVILLDCTWFQAAAMMKRVPSLALLPTISLTAARGPFWRKHSKGGPNLLSTAEALYLLCREYDLCMRATARLDPAAAAAPAAEGEAASVLEPQHQETVEEAVAAAVGAAPEQQGKARRRQQQQDIPQQQQQRERQQQGEQKRQQQQQEQQQQEGPRRDHQQQEQHQHQQQEQQHQQQEQQHQQQVQQQEQLVSLPPIETEEERRLWFTYKGQFDSLLFFFVLQHKAIQQARKHREQRGAPLGPLPKGWQETD
ncbi:hypothetical protein Emed_006326 [Eimeria media]